jgi:hypothetical protein
MPDPVQSTEPTPGELQHTLSVYTRERDSLLATIREARMEARRVTIEASSCKQSVPQAVIDRWQRQIRENAAELFSVEQKIGETNKQLRVLRATSKPAIKSLSQMPGSVAAPSKPEPVAANNGDINPTPKEGRILFLQFFHQLVAENLDPRMIEVLENDAHDLVNIYKATHPKENS